MDQIVTREMVVYTAFRDGRERGIDLEPDVLTRDNSVGINPSRLTVKDARESVGVIVGAVPMVARTGESGRCKAPLDLPKLRLASMGRLDARGPQPVPLVLGLHLHQQMANPLERADK